MKGLWFRFSENSGFAALYSGNEHANQRIYASIVRPGDVVVDGGANWGVHALYLAKLTGSTGRILAFEPHPEVVEELRWNVKKKRLPTGHDLSMRPNGHALRTSFCLWQFVQVQSYRTPRGCQTHDINPL